MKRGILVLTVAALLLGGWALAAPAARALPGLSGNGWMWQTTAMQEAVRSGDMWEYMNRPEIKEQLQNTQMGQFMYSEDMQKFMTSDAFREFSQSPTAQQMIEQGTGSCHGTAQSPNRGQTR